MNKRERRKPVSAVAEVVSSDHFAELLATSPQTGASIEGCGGVLRGCWRRRGVVVLMVTSLLLLSFTIFTPSYTRCLLRALDGPIPAHDPELVAYVANQVLVGPSSQPYQLLGADNVARLQQEHSELFYRHVLGQLFANKTGGFFVEAGALDGETMSNTLWLELQWGWTGLLVEADAPSFAQLLAKHRRAWAANVCLAPGPFPSKEMFSQLSQNPGPMAKALGFKMRSMHGLAKYIPKKTMSSSWINLVQCVPLETLLRAMRVTRVDLLVLDVEGSEVAILDHLDLDYFNVQVLCVEWKNTAQLDEVSYKVQRRGYTEVARYSEDLILVRDDSPYLAAHITISANFTTTTTTTTSLPARSS